MERDVIVEELNELHHGGFLASVSGTSENPVQVVVTSPLMQEEESSLRWYCEVSDSEPLVNVTQLHHIESRFRNYGLDLFKMVFGSPSTALPTDCKVTIRIVGRSRFCAMHWELLRDPDRGPVALDAARFIVRDVERKHVGDSLHINGFNRHAPHRNAICESNVHPHAIRKYPTFNIIFVTARKREDLIDIPLRVESLAVIERMRQHKRPFRFDLVRPGSLQALVAKLEEHEPGFYHVLHFDCHGTYGTDFSDSMPNSLLLENEHFGFVPAPPAHVARIVDRFQIPVVFVSACRSSYGISSFAHDLISQSSVQFVVAMALSVLFDTTARFAAEFYAAMLPLSGRATIREAAQRARRSMERNRQRLGALDRIIEREDWWIPVLYDRSAEAPPGSSHFELCSWDVILTNARLAQKCYKDRPLYEIRTRRLMEEYREMSDFLGRDDDLLKLEVKMLSQARTDNVLLLLGLIGIGKTTFLDYTSWWWHVTGLVHDSFVFRMNGRPYSVADMVRAIYARLFPEQNFEADEELLDFVTRVLNEKRYLIVIDGVENLRNGYHVDHCKCIDLCPNVNKQSFSAHQESCEQECCKHERKLLQLQKDIAKWLGQLHGGQTVVLVGSRGLEPELFEHVKGQSVGLDLTTNCNGFPALELRRLDDRASVTLAGRVLGIQDKPESPYHGLLKNRTLLERVGGNPFLIKVFFGSLVGNSITAIPSSDQLCKELQNLFNGYETGIDDCTLLKSVQFSYNRISSAEQRALTFLVPFKETVSKIGLQKYAAELKASEMPGFDIVAWDSAIEMAAKWGLLTRHERLQHGYYQSWRMHACLSAFLIKKHHRFENPDLSTATLHVRVSQTCESKKELKVLYKAYSAWAVELNEALQSKDRAVGNQGLLVAEVEYGNMEGVLNYALANRLPFYAILLLMYMSLDKVSRRDLCEGVVKRIGTYKRLADLPEEPSEDFRIDIPRTYHIYGVALGNNHMFVKADEYLTYANNMWQSLRWTEEQAATMQELGWVAMCQERCSVAENLFIQALGISDGMNEILARHNLGQLALLQESITMSKTEKLKKLDEAEESFAAALELASQRVGHKPEEAFSLHHLAIVAIRKGDLELAETHAKKSLSIREQLGNGHGADDGYANCLHLLANIAHKRAMLISDPRTKLVYVSAARSLFNKAFLRYNEYSVSRERDMLCENYGLLLATWGTCVATKAERDALRKTEMHSYELIKHGPFPKALFNLGQCLEELGEYSAAYEAYCAASEKRIDFIKDTQDHKARHMALMAKARCINTGTGVDQDQRRAVELVLESRGSSTCCDVFDEDFISRTIVQEWNLGAEEELTAPPVYDSREHLE